MRKLTSRSIAFRDAGVASDAACWHRWHDDVRRLQGWRCLLATCTQQSAYTRCQHAATAASAHCTDVPGMCVKAGVACAVAYVQACDVCPSCIRCQGTIRACYTPVPLLPVAAAAAAPPSFVVTSLRSFASFRYSPALRMAPCCISRDAQ